MPYCPVIMVLNSKW